MTTSRTLFALAACAALAGCPQQPDEGFGPPRVSPDDRRAPEVQSQDWSLALEAGNRIAERYGERVQVNVVSYNQAVLLTGAAPDRATKAELGKAVAALAGVRSVQNEVEVAGVPSREARASDAAIAARVASRLLGAGKLNPVHVRVVTAAGVVYLLGIVTEKEAEEAIEIARTTDGVRKVVRIFESCKPAGDGCLPRAHP